MKKNLLILAVVFALGACSAPTKTEETVEETATVVDTTVVVVDSLAVEMDTVAVDSTAAE
jgi:uncharacterized protein YcfL